MANVNAAPSEIKLGVLYDFDPGPGDRFPNVDDYMKGLRLTFDEALESGQLDRPVTLDCKVIQGLPYGDVHSVIKGVKEFVDDGCLAIFGPLVSDNAVVINEFNETEGHIPMLGWVGSDDWFGDWCFGLPNGSLTEEPYVIANYLLQQGVKTVAVAPERSLIGRQYYENFQRACDQEGLRIIATSWIPPIVVDDAAELARPLMESGPDALVVLGFGWGVSCMNDALAALKWSPLKMTNSGFEVAYVNDEVFARFAGWTGLDQYNETNKLGQAFLDRFERRYGRRPEYFIPLYAHDGGRVMAQAIADASPLSRRGIKDALERVKMLPSCLGTPDTRISFGKWQRRGWLGSGYQSVRQILDDGYTHVLKGHIGPPIVE